jgi:hypothetical protein
MGRKPVLMIIRLLLAGATMGFLASALQAAERPCGIVWGYGREIDESPRFELLGTGAAFVDMRTCLVWSLRWTDTPKTLNEGMETCAMLGQGGPTGDMGWQLPTMAELTSLEGEEWRRQAETFEKYHLPVAARNEAFFWTSTPWLGQPDSWAAVEFSARTTIVRPRGLSDKGGVWCVRGIPARGLRTP